MNKYIITFCIILSLVCSCQKNTDIHTPGLSDHPIIFDELYMESSAVKSAYDPVSGDFPSGSKVGVLAYCLTSDGGAGSTDWATKQQACIPFMPDLSSNPSELRGVELTKGLDGSWTYSSFRRWYDDPTYKYSFFAYSPYNDKYFTISTIGRVEEDGKILFKGAPVASFHLPFTSMDVTTPLDRTELRDAMLSNNIDRLSTQGNVGFQFYHMTAGLRFAVSNFDNEHALTIKSLTLSGIFNKEMSIEARTDYKVSGEYAGTFTVSDTELHLEPQEQSKFFRVGGNQDASKVTLLLIPNIQGNQPVIGVPGKEQPILTITYQFDNGIEKTEKFALPEMNYRVGIIHNISFDFLGNSLTLTASSSEWDNEYTSDIIFE